MSVAIVCICCSSISFHYCTVEDGKHPEYSEALTAIFGPEVATITQWKQEFLRRRIIAAEIYANCVQDYNLMFYLSGKLFFPVVCNNVSYSLLL